MIYLVMTPDVSSIRSYEQPDGYQKRLPYLAILKVTHLNDKTVYLHSAVGKIDRETRKQAFAMLREQGVTEIMMERRGRLRTIELK